MAIMHKNYLKVIKNIFKYCLIVFFIIVVLPFFLLETFHIIPNNLALRELKRNFDNLEIPEDTEKLADDSFVDNFIGTGDKCMLVVSTLFSTKKDYQDILNFYTDKKIASPGLGENVEVRLGFYNKGELRLLDSSMHNYQIQMFKDKLPFEKYCTGKRCYMVYAIDISTYRYEIRCQ